MDRILGPRLTVDQRRRLAAALTAIAVVYTLGLLVALQDNRGARDHLSRSALAKPAGGGLRTADPRPALTPRLGSSSDAWGKGSPAAPRSSSRRSAPEPLQEPQAAKPPVADAGQTPGSRAQEEPVEPPPDDSTTTVPTTPPPSTPLEISDLDLRASDMSVSVSWRTSLPAQAQGAYGSGSTQTAWTPRVTASDVVHQTEFRNLTPATTYHLVLQAVDAWGRVATVAADVATPPPPDEHTDPPTVGTDGDTILLRGNPFFPRALLEECSNFVPQRIQDGINLFIGDGCDGDRPNSPHPISSALDGRAFAIADQSAQPAGAPGTIGWYYVDELDARLPVPVTSETLNAVAMTPPDGLLSFLTLTNHFYTGADVLPQGRDFYPTLINFADVVGFDLYPLQNWCRADKLFAVYDAQRELQALARDKPTFQWIEVRGMDCRAPALEPTAATVRAETWLAIAGGADGIGYFPREWTPSVGREIRHLNDELDELGPALLADEVDGQSEPADVKVGTWTLNGAVYVAAVNASHSPLDATIRVPELGGRAVDVLEENRTIAPENDVLRDHFDPLGVHLYLAAPPGWVPPAIWGTRVEPAVYDMPLHQLRF